MHSGAATPERVPFPPTREFRTDRAFSAQKLAESAAVEGLLLVLLQQRNCLVSVPDFRRAVTSGEAPVSLRTAALHRFPRIILPAILAGRVYVVKRRQQVFVGHVNLDHLQLPDIGQMTDLRRVESALIQHVTQQDSAVSVESLEQFISANPQYRLQRTGRSVAQHIKTLVVTNRALVVDCEYSCSGRKKYYSMPDGPRRVRPAELRDIDKRQRVVTLFWRLIRRRPFTTTAVRAFSESRLDLRFENDPTWAWTANLCSLEKRGFLQGIRDSQYEQVLWVVAADWSDMAEEMQRQRLADGLRGVLAAGNGEVCQADTATNGGGEGPVDAQFRSRNADTRALVRLAKRSHGDAPDGCPPERWALRPVTIGELRTTAKVHPDLLRGEELLPCLQEASRQREEMVRSSIVKVGLIGNSAIYDLHKSPEGDAFVAWKRAMRRSRLHFIPKELARLEADLECAAGGLIVVAPTLLAVRALHAGYHALQLRVNLERNEAVAPLTRAERDQSREAMEVTHGWERDAAELSQKIGENTASPTSWTSALTPEELPADALVGLSSALDQLIRIGVGDADAKSALFASLRARVVTTRRPSERPQWRSAGRQEDTFLDRVGLSLYSLRRWGGPHANLQMTGVESAIGMVRTTSHLMAILDEGLPDTFMATAILALGMDDSPASRAKVTQWGLRKLSQRNRRTLPDIEQALATALAPKLVGGLATFLMPDESLLLEMLTEKTPGSFASNLARATLDAWERPELRKELFRL